MREEPIPGFENYTINTAGEVFNRRTGRRLRPTHQAGRPNGFYQLYTRGRKYNRSEKSLYELTYGREDEDRYEENGVEWRTIQAFPNYELNTFGEARRKDTKARMVPEGTNSGIYYFRFRRDGKQHRYRDEQVFADTFPEIYENVR